VLKCPINPTTSDPNPVYSHSITWHCYILYAGCCKLESRTSGCKRGGGGFLGHLRGFKFLNFCLISVELIVWELTTPNWKSLDFFIILSGVRLGSTWYCGHYWPIVPTLDDRWWWLWSNCWEWRLAEETEVLRENLPLAPLCPPQIPHDNTRFRTRTAAVESQRLTAWAMSRPLFCMLHSITGLPPLIELEKSHFFNEKSIVCNL
jgi:hypothetical protein